MKFVIAPDSFKESMSASRAAEAMRDGVLTVFPDAECVTIPMSDGGEGFAEAVTAAWGAEWVEIDAVDALHRPLRAGYGLSNERAVVDIASAAGLEHIAPAERVVAHSSSAGLGMLVRDAVRRGARQIIVGIGGSATNDGGAGMLVALGARLLDGSGKPCDATLAGLAEVVEIETAGLAANLEGATFLVACDVNNPLTGPRGATAVFGPQKGVAAEQIEEFDGVLARFAEIAGKSDVAARPGAGAAGGVGFALMAFLDAELRPGVELLSEVVNLAEEVKGADFVLTGEGSVDSQTLEGKTPAGVAKVASNAGVRTLLFAGKVKAGAELLLEHGVAELVQIAPDGVTLEESLAKGPENLERAVSRSLGKYRI